MPISCRAKWAGAVGTAGVAAVEAPGEGGYGNLANRAERKGSRLDTNCPRFPRWSESRHVFVDRGGSFLQAGIAAQPNTWRTSSLHHSPRRRKPSIAVFLKRSPDWLVITHFAWSACLFWDRLERDEEYRADPSPVEAMHCGKADKETSAGRYTEMKCVWKPILFSEGFNNNNVFHW